MEFFIASPGWWNTDGEWISLKDPLFINRSSAVIFADIKKKYPEIILQQRARQPAKL